MLLDGREIARSLREAVADKIKKLQLPYKPMLCDIVIGADSVSLSYVRVKGKAAESVGMAFRLEQLSQDATTADVIDAISEIQSDQALCGLIIQLPVPDHIDKDAVLNAIAAEYDVDCIGAENNNAFYRGQGGMVPPTAGAIWHILLAHFTSKKEKFEEKEFTVVGQGELVGRPTAFLLQEMNLEVEVADKSVADLKSLTRRADVLISGTGIAGLINGDMVKPGAVVIDAGTSESGAGIVGDVDLESVAPVASYVSPVPGGVGPVTVAKLLENVALVAETKSKLIK